MQRKLKTNPTAQPEKLKKHPPNDRRSRRKRERKKLQENMDMRVDRLRKLARELGAEFVV